MFTEARGKMFDWLSRSGRPMGDCGGVSPVRHLERHGLLGKNVLAVHVNYLAAGDAALLAKRKTSVVHCPRSHAYFKHRPFPFAEMVSANLNVCLGTDSLASVQKTRKQSLELSMFDEMREVAAANPALKPKTILQMATVNGAFALGLKNQVGEIIPNALADLVAIPYAGKTADAYEAAVNHRGNVTASMINGEWALLGGDINSVRAKPRSH
jgi:cytosine/adenosine deaminase-related metal-dependent hydrolase